MLLLFDYYYYYCHCTNEMSLLLFRIRKTFNAIHFIGKPLNQRLIKTHILITFVFVLFFFVVLLLYVSFLSSHSLILSHSLADAVAVQYPRFSFIIHLGNWDQFDHVEERLERERERKVFHSLTFPLVRVLFGCTYSSGILPSWILSLSILSFILLTQELISKHKKGKIDLNLEGSHFKISPKM